MADRQDVVEGITKAGQKQLARERQQWKSSTTIVEKPEGA